MRLWWGVWWTSSWGNLFEGTNFIGALPGWWVWNRCRRTFVLTTRFCLAQAFRSSRRTCAAAATGTADHPHADVRPPSLPIFLLPLHSQCPPSLFFTQERHTRRFFPSHTRNCAGSCVIRVPPPPPPPLPPPHSKFAPSNRHSRFERHKLVWGGGGVVSDLTRSPPPPPLSCITHFLPSAPSLLPFPSFLPAYSFLFFFPCFLRASYFVPLQTSVFFFFLLHASFFLFLLLHTPFFLRSFFLPSFLPSSPCFSFSGCVQQRPEQNILPRI